MHPFTMYIKSYSQKNGLLPVGEVVSEDVLDGVPLGVVPTGPIVGVVTADCTGHMVSVND